MSSHGIVGLGALVLVVASLGALGSGCDRAAEDCERNPNLPCFGTGTATGAGGDAGQGGGGSTSDAGSTGTTAWIAAISRSPSPSTVPPLAR